MMTSFSKEDLLPKIPALKVDGSNWLTFKNHVEWATEAKGLIEYLEGTKLKPIDPSEGQDPLAIRKSMRNRQSITYHFHAYHVCPKVPF